VRRFDVQRIWEMGKAQNRGSRSGTGARGDLATVAEAAESDVELALALGVGGRRAVPFVGESPGVERRKADRVCCARDELEARSVDRAKHRGTD